MTAFTMGPAFIQVNFTGLNGAGSISIPGLQVGDVVVWAGDGSDAQSDGAFENQVSVAGELQQTGTGNLSSASYTAFLIRWAQR